MFDFTMLVDTFNLRLQLESVFFFNIALLFLFYFKKLTDGYFIFKIEKLVFSSHVLHLVFELLGNHLTIYVC